MTPATASVISLHVSPHGAHLRGFLARVRRISLRREAVTWAGRGASAAIALVALSAGVTALNGRGDLAAPTAALALVVLLAVGSVHFLRFRASLGDPAAVARWLRAHDLPLSPLRAEILAATELTDRLAAPLPPLPSPELAAEYIYRVEARLSSIEPRDLVRPHPRAPWAIALLLLAAVAIAQHESAWYRAGFEALLAARDARPPAPPRPLWSRLTIRIAPPPHSGRPVRELLNPSATLRVLAGARLEIILDPLADLSALNALITPEGPPATTRSESLERTEDGRWHGTVVVDAPSTLRLLGEAPGSQLRSAPLQVEIEADAPPEIDLLPLAAHERDVSELDRVDLRFRARDDFGLTDLTLIFVAPGGEPTRLPLGRAPAATRQWSHRATWDLAGVSLADREALEYWLEIRDNDPGYGPDGPLDPPGKIAESARMRLSVRDREGLHATNIGDLQALRDAALDHLAHRLLTNAFERGSPALRAVDDARALHHEAAALLATLAALIDRLTTDTLTRERDVAGLIAIHRRLFALHREEAEAHQRLPPGAEHGASARVQALQAVLAGIHPRQIQQLEDELIRLDDLVDNLHIDRIEILADRLQAAQQRLVELLERLRAGDRSAEAEIAPLQQRIREYLRKIAEARAKLQKEVGHDFMNLDALRNIQAQIDHQDLSERLRRGDIDGAIEEARGALDQLRQLRQTVLDRQADPAHSRLTPEERAKMSLLRELSRIQDAERGLHGESRDVHQLWRTAARAAAPPPDAAAQRRRIDGISRGVEAINDARLGREGRRALEDAQESLRRAGAATDPLDAYEAAEAAARSLRAALASAEPGAPEAKALRPLADRAERLASDLRGALPRPAEAFDDPARARLDELARRQGALRERSAALLTSEEAKHLPEAGEAALRGAIASMEGSRGGLDARESAEALDRQADALQAIQRAIDSLRAATPPPRGGASGPSSMESERDRSLRDDLLDAMRERAPDGFAEPVKRYYEELLR